MRREIIILLLALCVVGTASAQSWRKLRNTAEEQLEKGQLDQAAINFEKAWKKKTKKKELIFKAGEAYYTLRDYRKAAECYQHVQDEADEYPLVGLKYARSLKQDGQYDNAITSFNTFIEKYVGSGRAILEEVVRKEVEGCELGKKMAAENTNDLELTLLGSEINSESAEFAPFALTDSYLYFSSAKGEKARVYVSHKVNGSWETAENPSNFPIISTEHYANAVITPDERRVYFTICSSDQEWQNINTRCEIFVTKKQGSTWAKPERLPDYINMKDVTTTHPYIAHVDGEEILYFASNREGGRGGMDIWMATRDLNSIENDFSFPVNLGGTVNTLGDEISPYYNATEGTLYFSSNGLTSLGGYDIFSSKGKSTTWSTPENIGLPYNSSADDYYFVQNATQTGGFLSSNRAAGEKTSTRHDDLFEFVSGDRPLMLTGDVYNQVNAQAIPYSMIQLYQVYDDGSENLLYEKSLIDGHYTLELLPNRKMRAVFSADGFETKSMEITTDENTYEYGESIFLTPVLAVEDDEIVFEDDSANTNSSETTNNNTEIENTGSNYTLRGTSEKDQREYMSAAPRYSGDYYKIQVAALSNFSSDFSKFDALSGLGTLETEELVESGLIRILVANFFTEEEAKAALQSAKDSRFRSAFIVKYTDGVRYGRVNF